MTVAGSAGVASDGQSRLTPSPPNRLSVYRARDRVENEAWLADLGEAADRLGLSGGARSRAADLFLSNVPDSERSKRAVLATSLYVASLTVGDGRSQTAVAEATGVSRLTIQQRWKEILEDAGLEAPDW